jgi:hypothetical protein
MISPMKIVMILLLLSATTGLYADFPVDKPSPEQRAIFRTINYYFHGPRMYDIDALKKAYHPDANFSFIDRETGALEQFTATQYFVMINESAHVVQTSQLIVRSIDITGNAALVKAEIMDEKKGRRISDYLSLLKIGGEWKIVNRTSYKDYASFGMEQDRRAAPDDLATIDDVLWTYLGGTSDHDLNAFEASLHPAAAVAYVNEKNGDLQAFSRPEYMVWQASLTGQELGRRQEILAVDAVGYMATAKVRTFYKRYKATTTDYLVLMKSEGEWQIVHKITYKDKKAFLAPA